MTPKNHNSKTDWKSFLTICRKTLGRGSWNPFLSESWCAYTTFSSLEHNIVYWSCGFPDLHEILEDRTLDGGLWRQEFFYKDIAHIVVPKKFYWENVSDDEFSFGYKIQDIDELSLQLSRAYINHRKSDILLEIKLY